MRLMVHLAGDWPLEVRQGREGLEVRTVRGAGAEEGEGPGPWRECAAVDFAIGKLARIYWTDPRDTGKFIESDSAVERIVCTTHGVDDELQGAFLGAS